MRKIKITALLLAVLMVVTAFAGCASKSTVTNLDDKVNDLDGKIQEQANALAGIQDSLKDISEALGNEGSTGLDDIKADVEANKQSVADILAAIEGLKDAVAGATGESEDVKTAINQAGAKIDALKADYADNKKHYIAEDYAAIIETLGAAQAAISACVTAEAVAAVVATMEADLAKCVRVDDSIYAYYVQLTGNITAESEALVKEAKAALDAAKKFYNKAEMPEALTEYEYDEDEEELNLITAIGDLYDQQFTKLGEITKKAKDIVKAIDKAAAGESVDLDAIRRDYKNFVKDAKKLSEKNVELVTNAGMLTELIESAEKINDALEAVSEDIDWEFPSMLRVGFGTDVRLFADYEKLAETNKQSVINFATKKSNKNAIARTIAIYDAIDSRLADLAEEYELSEDGLALVIAKWKGEDFLAKYEADKALVKAFEAEYEKLSDGVFADIEKLASEALTVSSAFDVATAYKNNADAINAWNKALVEAYTKEYRALEDTDKVSYNITATAANSYQKLVLANFQAMVVEAELVGWYDADSDADSVEWKHDAEFVYEGAFDDDNHNDGTNDFYYDLYDFVRADNEKLATFLTTTFEDANAAAVALNTAIKDYRENQAVSIVELVTTIGGYVEVTTKNGKQLLTAISTETDDFADGANGYAAGTIAHFMYEYKTENYDLSGLINVEAYDLKVAAIEKNIEDAEAALKALMTAYQTLLGDKDTVIVTLDNADEIIKLKALLVDVNANLHVAMQKAVLKNTTADDIKEYELKALVDEYLADEQSAEDFYKEVLLATNFADTDKNADINTGAIIRLVYKAETLKKEETIVVSAYNMIKKLNSATGGKAFSYNNNKNGYSTVTKMANGDYKNLGTYGYLYGVMSYEETSTVVDGKTEYGFKMSFVRYTTANGFYEGSRDSLAVIAEANYESIPAAREAAWNYIKSNSIAGAFAINSAEAFAKYMFAEDGYLLKTIKNTDSESLGSVLNNKVVPSFALPMIASYLESKFIINNMGKTTAAITTAKSGWGEPTSNYGFDYIKAMVVNLLNGKVNDSRLSAIGAAVNYEKLTLAVQAACQDVSLRQNITFGHADATWLSATYDIRVLDYAKNGSEAIAINSDYAAHGINLDDLVVDAIVVYIAE